MIKKKDKGQILQGVQEEGHSEEGGMKKLFLVTLHKAAMDFTASVLLLFD